MDASGPYHIELIKAGPHVAFSIAHRFSPKHDLQKVEVFHWVDDGETYGPVLGGGQIGFRQMAPMIGEYANLRIESVRVGD